MQIRNYMAVGTQLTTQTIPAHDIGYEGKIAEVIQGSLFMFCHEDSEGHDRNMRLVGRFDEGSYLGLGYQGKWPEHVVLETRSADVRLANLDDAPAQDYLTELLSKDYAILFNTFPMQTRLSYGVTLAGKDAKPGLLSRIAGCTREEASRTLNIMLRSGKLRRNSRVYALSESYEQKVDMAPVDHLIRSKNKRTRSSPWGLAPSPRV
jgi:hypothetical protein